MIVYDLIKKKRDGGELSDGEIRGLITEFVAGTIPNYQMSALLMAIFYRGMSTRELAVWTDAMIDSGDRIKFDGAGPYVDKHSTGGVGDKVSLPLAPIVAALGLRDPMISGRGLGHTGGTLDKLESIPGFTTGIPVQRFKHIVDTVGCCIIGQTAKLVPADKLLYALRDVTATVDSIPLIASSILSKKRASGIQALVQDVKVGSGAFMKTEESAVNLAKEMVSLGAALGLEVRAYITDMDQPLGVKCGNALEVVETIDVLRGQGPADLTAVVEEFAAAMLDMGGVEHDRERAVVRVREAVGSGRALETFAKMVEAQGGDPKVVERPEMLPAARIRKEHVAARSGVVASIDVEKVGQAIVSLGGGRRRIEDAIDPGVGLEALAKVGDKVAAGQALAVVHYSDEARLPEAQGLLERAYVIQDGEVGRNKLIRREVRR